MIGFRRRTIFFKSQNPIRGGERLRKGILQILFNLAIGKTFPQSTLKYETSAVELVIEIQNRSYISFIHSLRNKDVDLNAKKLHHILTSETIAL
jgi:hypothetical protein